MERTSKRVNFSAQEKEELIFLVSKYREVIESKKTNGVSPKDKEHTWEQIHFEFNSKGLNTFRTKDQLKKYWANIKQLERQAAASLKINRLGTGGGPFQPQNEPDENVLDIINAKTVSGLDNEFDDEILLEQNLPIILETENQNTEYTQISSGYVASVIKPKTDNILNCKEVTVICNDSQPGTSRSNNSSEYQPLSKRQKINSQTKVTPPYVEPAVPPKLDELKAQFLSSQIEELKEKVEMRKQERLFQGQLQALQLKEKQAEVDILLQKKIKLELENDALEREIKKKCT
ncbi:myb/SANT-like DNA-binding domain-containing protein 4 [Diabrotica virgifera virgifera]|uniref:Regulatory protein zeste n=1 Tax=Diabrotica virgifera virgifera TaxID=50390 RepID=A0ABM5JU86_DIAVI|nr:myb/SANT-like DNA-binding domain-containing protein 4 [Diabrotica virgifera virgifera]